MLLDLFTLCIVALGIWALWLLPWTDGEIEKTDRAAREVARSVFRRLR